MLLFKGQRFKIAFCIISLMYCTYSTAQKATLRVVTELSPPEQTIIDGLLAGTATTKVKNILAKADLEANIELYPWARAYNKALTESNTLIYSIAKTEEREKQFYWLAPLTHLKLGWVSLQQRNDIIINQPEDAKRYRTVVQRDDISHQWLVSHGFIENQHFITCSDVACSWQLLLYKKVDLIIESPDLIKDMLKHFNKPLNTAKFISFIPELEITAYLAASKKFDPVLLHKLQQAIEDL